MRTKEITFPNEEPPVRIVVARATNAIGAKRLKLLEEIDDWVKSQQVAGAEIDTALLGWRYTSAPLLAATIEVEGLPWPMTPEYFMNELPEEISEAWYDAVMELNPHWNRRIADLLEAQKKVIVTT